MPLFALYVIKLSVSLSVLYLFYWLVLRRLTFYNWNRWYLFGYSLFAFFIPFINVAGVLNESGTIRQSVITIGPQLEAFTIKPLLPTDSIEAPTFSPWDWLLLVLAAGWTLLAVRLLVQYLSCRRIRQEAQLISNDGVKLFHVDRPIAPFSFSNAIFINRHRHSPEELREIIRHEVVHVQQRHTADVLWGEVLCLLNWFNPFAWLLRRAIRQNLEFIADNKVLQEGTDKKAYQYLLLNVMGSQRFGMTTPFSFSSLKKRIIMMNKTKSAQLHLVKFLFALPVLVVLLLAFGRKAENTFWLTGLTLDAETQQPVKGVEITEKNSGVKTVSDENGFYKLAIPSTGGEWKINALFRSAAHRDHSANIGPMPGGQLKSVVEFIYLAAADHSSRSHAYSVPTGIEPDYAYVAKQFAEHTKEATQEKKLKQIIGDSEKPIWVIDGIPYAIGTYCRAWFNEDEMRDSPEFRVVVNGKVMTMEEANATVKRSEVSGAGAFSRFDAMKKYGVNYNLLTLTLAIEVGK